MVSCPKCGRPLVERETDYYCLKDDALFEKRTRQEIQPEILREETESDYEEAKRRFRVSIKGLFRRTDEDVDKIIEKQEKDFAKKNLSPFMRILALESLQEGYVTMRHTLSGPWGAGRTAKGIPLRGPLTPQQEALVAPMRAKFCRACGAKAQPDANYCRECGASLR